MDNLIPIFIPDEEARKFLEFQKHYDLFMLLLDKKVFDQKSASVTLHFDHLGNLQAINRADFLYSRRFDK